MFFVASVPISALVILDRPNSRFVGNPEVDRIRAPDVLCVYYIYMTALDSQRIHNRARLALAIETIEEVGKRY